MCIKDSYLIIILLKSMKLKMSSINYKWQFMVKTKHILAKQATNEVWTTSQIIIPRTTILSDTIC